VTLIRVTPEVDRAPSDLSSEIAQIVESLGGVTEGVWALGSGPYQLVSVATYPDGLSASRARARIEALGVFTLEGYPVSEMPECLQAMAS
jgi:hypothetical protein